MIDTLERGRDAVRRHARTEAIEPLSAAGRDGQLTPDDLELLGSASGWAGRPDEANDAFERPFRGYIEAGRPYDAGVSAETRRARVPTFPELDTERLHLREFTDADAPWYLEQFSRPETNGIDLFRQGNGVRWAICLRAADGRPSPAPIGSCALLDWEDEPISRAELGYSLEPAQWGLGYASEALIAIQWFGFEVMGLDRIDALVWEHNERSIKVLERLAYHREELLRESFQDSTGRLRNEWRFALVRPRP